MNVPGAPKRITFTILESDATGSTNVYLSINPPIGDNFNRLAVLSGTVSGVSTYYADLTAEETTAGGVGYWRCMPYITGADPLVFPKYIDDAKLLTFEPQWSTTFNENSILTPAQLKEHISTELDDTALQRIIDAEEASINDYFGALGTQIEEFDDATPDELIFPARTISTITSIVEKFPDTFLGGYQSTTLDTTDYEIVPGNKAIRRLGSGTHPLTSWGRRVVVTYTPSSETAKRVLALINLCKLNMVYNGLKSESVGGGEYSMTQGDYDNQRAQILAGLASTHRSYA